MNIIFKVSSPRQITAEGMVLEPLGEKVLSTSVFFSFNEVIIYSKVRLKRVPFIFPNSFKCSHAYNNVKGLLES